MSKNNRVLKLVRKPKEGWPTPPFFGHQNHKFSLWKTLKISGKKLEKGGERDGKHKGKSIENKVQRRMVNPSTFDSFKPQVSAHKNSVEIVQKHQEKRGKK